MTSSTSVLRCLLLALVCAALVGCGGGGTDTAVDQAAGNVAPGNAAFDTASASSSLSAATSSSVSAVSSSSGSIVEASSSSAAATSSASSAATSAATSESAAVASSSSSAATSTSSSSSAAALASSSSSAAALASSSSSSASSSSSVALAPPAALRYPSPDEFDSGESIATLLPSVTGTVTAFAVSPALPSALHLDAHNGEITGMPSVPSVQAHYVVTATNAAGNTSFDLALSVRAPQEGPTYPIGFLIVQLPSGLKAAIWYPAAPGPGQGAYPAGLSSDFTYYATPLATQRWPLVLYTHGDMGCAYQSVFLNEALARHGYVVAAMDHADALSCSLDSGPVRGPDPVLKPPYEHPETWDETTVAGRRNDLRSLADFMLGTEPWQTLIDSGTVGLAGYSLGGYTALGLMGGRGSWYDPRFHAALLMAPYTAPYLVAQSMAQIRAPLMFLVGADDAGMTPYVRGAAGPFNTGAYDAANPAKYYAEFAAADHLAWTMADCPGAVSVADCVQTVPRKRVMAAYAVAFFDHALRGTDHPTLRTQDPAVVTLRYAE